MEETMNKKDILELMQKLDESSLAEISLKDGEFELTIKKTGEQPQISYVGGTAAASQAPAPASAQAPPAGSSVPGETSGAGSEGPSDIDTYETITAPIVGTFYRTPSPDAPAFVDEGSEVDEGDTLCIIEAMKVMNELEAEFPCRIHRVLVENQQMVEYGTPLFEVERLS
jgi:acetyl-CoA carboxylase biotin carboxyl carrier protein